MNIVLYLYSGTKLAECIRSILVVMGIQKIYNIFNMRKLNTHPTENMYRAREFYNNHIGLSARQRNSGWDFKGSPYDNTFIPQNKCSYVKEYHQNILNQIKTNIVFDSDYIVADKINETEWDTLLNIINYCEKKNIRLLIFLPPFSPEIYEAMITSGQYEYLTDLQTRLMLLENEKNFQLFDFTYMPETKPENFSDGHHGDPFVYRIITDKILSVYNKQL